MFDFTSSRVASPQGTRNVRGCGKASSAIVEIRQVAPSGSEILRGLLRDTSGPFPRYFGLSSRYFGTFYEILRDPFRDTSGPSSRYFGTLSEVLRDPLRGTSGP